MEPLNQRQGFLVSAIVHLTFLMLLISHAPADKTGPVAPLEPPRETARVFVPLAAELRKILPARPDAPRPAPTPAPTPPPKPGTKDRISIGPPLPLQQKGPLILRKEDDLTKVPKGQPDAVPSPSVPVPPVATPTPEQAADAGAAPKAPGAEGLRLPPGLGQEMTRGNEGSKGETVPRGPISSSLRNFERRLEKSGPLGLPSGTGQQVGPLFFDPLGADFTVWINHFKNEVYRNWIMPQPALMGIRGHVDVEFTVERDGSLSRLSLLTSSGNSALDKAAMNALASSRLLPLPSDYGPKSVTMRAAFFYNEGPAGS